MAVARLRAVARARVVSRVVARMVARAEARAVARAVAVVMASAVVVAVMVAVATVSFFSLTAMGIHGVVFCRGTLVVGTVVFCCATPLLIISSPPQGYTASYFSAALWW